MIRDLLIIIGGENFYYLGPEDWFSDYKGEKVKVNYVFFFFFNFAIKNK